jgi:hypothetical protein
VFELLGAAGLAELSAEETRELAWLFMIGSCIPLTLYVVLSVVAWALAYWGAFGSTSSKRFLVMAALASLPFVGLAAFGAIPWLLSAMT